MVRLAALVRREAAVRHVLPRPRATCADVLLLLCGAPLPLRAPLPCAALRRSRRYADVLRLCGVPLPPRAPDVPLRPWPCAWLLPPQLCALRLRLRVRAALVPQERPRVSALQLSAW